MRTSAGLTAQCGTACSVRSSACRSDPGMPATAAITRSTCCGCSAAATGVSHRPSPVAVSSSWAADTISSGGEDATGTVAAPVCTAPHSTCSTFSARGRLFTASSAPGCSPPARDRSSSRGAGAVSPRSSRGGTTAPGAPRRTAATMAS